MINKKVFAISFFLICLSKVISQSSNLEQVAYAILQIDINGKIEKCKTDAGGNFAISFSDELNFAGNKIIANVKIASSISKKSSDNNSVKLILNKNENLYYEFILQYDNLQKKFIISPQNNIKGKDQQIKRGKGDASKPGDKYMGQVAHF